MKGLAFVVNAGSDVVRLVASDGEDRAERMRAFSRVGAWFALTVKPRGARCPSTWLRRCGCGPVAHIVRLSLLRWLGWAALTSMPA